MKKSYLPNHASILESCEWMKEQTGEAWTLSRLLEYGLMPWFWFDYSLGWPAIFGDKIEGYLAPIVFAGDMQRLSADGRDVLVNMTRTHDDKLMKIGPPALRMSIDELRFLRDDITRLSSNLSKPATDAKPATDEINMGTNPNSHDWKAQARQIAEECFDRDTINTCRDSLKGYSGRVMEEMQKRGINGPRGIIDNENTVMREALQGKKWWADKIR